MTNTYNDQIQKLSLMELMMEWKHINDLIADHHSALKPLHERGRLIEELIKSKDDALKKKAHEEQSKIEQGPEKRSLLSYTFDEIVALDEASFPNKPKFSVDDPTPEIKSVIKDINGREIDLDTEIKNISFVPIDYPSARMINTRIINTLAKENIVFLDEIVVLDEASLLRIDGISTTTVRHIKEFLRANKLTLKD